VKPFRFRASALLAIRRKRRDEAQANLATAERAARGAAADFERAEGHVKRAADECAEVLREGGDVDRLERHRNWITCLQTETLRLKGVLDERTRAVAGAVKVLRATHQEVRVLERLRERLLRRHEQIVREHEMKEIDQIATLRYARRFIQGGSDRDY
jgi:flagellar export protein FliJ